jgi:hypothetical protein
MVEEESTENSWAAHKEFTVTRFKMDIRKPFGCCATTVITLLTLTPFHRPPIELLSMPENGDSSSNEKCSSDTVALTAAVEKQILEFSV